MGLVLILVLVAAGVLVFRMQGGSGQQTSQPQPTKAPTKTILILAQPVHRGDKITQDHIRPGEIPLDMDIPGALEKEDDAIGRRAKFDMEPGMPLTSAVLVDIDQQVPLGGSNWALAIDPGKVAVSIPISRLSAVSYAPEPGDHVDVIATLLLVDIDTDFQTILPNLTGGVVSPGDVEYQAQAGASGEVDQSTGTIKGSTTNVAAQVVGGGRSAVIGRTEIDPVLGLPFYVLPSEPQRPRMVSQAILRDVVVLGVGTFGDQNQATDQQQGANAAEPGTTPPGTQPGQNPSPQATPQAQQVTRPPDVITLMVSPQDAVTLNYLIYAGAEMSLALRSAIPDPNELVPTQPVTLQYLMDTYNIPMPAKLPYGIEPNVQKLQAPELPNDKPLPTPTQ
ncbi:MAG: Flp pilus assembly protein CpaB [Anaerolineae bacterium]|nr:MAG: Flp pilus assembly protein CpaB [Anaerolineae bacterium]